MFPGVLAVGLLLPAGPVRLDADGLPLPAEAVCRVGSARFRAADRIGDVVPTPDGRTLVAVDGDDLIGWDAVTGVPRYRVGLPAGAGHRLSIPPGRAFVRAETLTEDKRFVVTRHDLATGRPLGRPDTLLTNVRGEPFVSPSGRYMIERYEDVVRRYSIDETDHVIAARPAAGPPVELVRERWAVTVAVSPDDRLLAVGSLMPPAGTRANARLIDLTTGRTVHDLLPDVGGVSELAFTPDGRSVVGWYGSAVHEETNGFARRTLAVWDTATGRRRDVVTRPGSADQTRLRLTPDGRAAVTYGHEVRDVATGAVLFTGPGSGDIVAVSPNGRTAYVHAVTDGAMIEPRDVVTDRPTLDRGDAGAVEPHVLTADGRLVGRAGGRFAAWDVWTGRLIARGPAVEDEYIPPDAAVSPDGRLGLRIGSGPNDQKPTVFTLHDLATGSVRATCGGHAPPLLEAQFVAGGRRVISTEPGGFRVWDTATGGQVGGGRLDGYTGHYVALLGAVNRTAAVSPDGRWFASTAAGDRPADSSLLVWDIATPGRPVRLFAAAGAASHHAVFSPDSRRVAAAGPREVDGPASQFGHYSGWSVRVWDVATGRVLCGLTFADGHLGAPVFSPDGRTLAVLASGERSG